MVSRLNIFKYFLSIFHHAMMILCTAVFTYLENFFLIGSQDLSELEL